LVVTGRRKEVLDRLAFDLDAEVLVADLASREEVDRIVGEVGEVDILVSNAALPAGGEVQTFSVAELDRALEVNLRAPMVPPACWAPVWHLEAEGISSLSLRWRRRSPLLA
jgi:NADP-dependent 3-hydroxy acid dehydrogenase YdfG